MIKQPVTNFLSIVFSSLWSLWGGSDGSTVAGYSQYLLSPTTKFSQKGMAKKMTGNTFFTILFLPL